MAETLGVLNSLGITIRRGGIGVEKQIANLAGEKRTKADGAYARFCNARDAVNNHKKKARRRAKEAVVQEPVLNLQTRAERAAQKEYLAGPSVVMQCAIQGVYTQ